MYKAYICFTGLAWMHYDEKFRIRVYLNPALRWDQVHPALCLQVLPFAKPNMVELSHSGHVVQRTFMGRGPHPKVGQVVQPCPDCWEFSSQGARSWKVCNYKHECSLCSGSNALSACPEAAVQARWVSDWKRVPAF